MTIPDDDREEINLRFVQYYNDSTNKKEYIIRDIDKGIDYIVEKDEGNEIYRKLLKIASCCIKII